MEVAQALIDKIVLRMNEVVLRGTRKAGQWDDPDEWRDYLLALNRLWQTVTKLPFSRSLVDQIKAADARDASTWPDAGRLPTVEETQQGTYPA